MKKRIALLVGSPGPRDLRLARMAASARYEIKVFFCRRRQEDQQWQVGELRYPAVFLRNWAPSGWYGCRLISDVNPGIWRALSEFRPGAVVIHGFATVTCLVAVLWARCHRVPFLLRGDSNYLDEADPSRRRNGLRRRFLRWLVRRAAAFLSVGKLNHQFWAAYGADARRIFFVPYAVDTDYFREQADIWRARRAEIRAEKGWTQDYVLLYVGRLVRKKRVDVLIATMQKLERTRKDIRLLIVGDGVEYTPLAEQARGLGNVHFLGFRDLPDLPQYYAIADAFVLPSEIEPWGIVVAEALACGLPVIATRKVGAAWDLIQDGKNGYVVPENDAAALAVAIDRACKSNSLASGDREFQGGVADWGIDSYVQGLHAALDYCLPDSG
ncbi:MAG: glycosyltransferase family 4 protein [Terriglobia bacterium]|jgi:glycosyltransferase involved in cell wall biosynthesis